MSEAYPQQPVPQAQPGQVNPMAVQNVQNPGQPAQNYPPPNQDVLARTNEPVPIFCGACQTNQMTNYEFEMKTMSYCLLFCCPPGLILWFCFKYLTDTTCKEWSHKCPNCGICYYQGDGPSSGVGSFIGDQMKQAAIDAATPKITI